MAINHPAEGLPPNGDDDLPRHSGNDVPRYGDDDVPRYGGNEVAPYGDDDVPRYGDDDLPRHSGNDVPRYGGNDVARHGDDLPRRRPGVQHRSKHVCLEARPELRDRETYYAELRYAVHYQRRPGFGLPPAQRSPFLPDTWT